ncbi:MAG: helix-turn-helix transcriptional regulator [Christensenellales bacterium]|jgi:predicted transcriptional regulator
MNLKSYRIKRGLSVPALFHLSDVPVRTIEDVERRGDCRVSTAIKLADALGITLDALCRNSLQERPKDKPAD